MITGVRDSLRIPGSYSEIVKGSGGGLPSRLQKMLIFGEAETGANFATPGTLELVFSADNAKARYGEDSTLFKMINAAFRQFSAANITVYVLPQNCDVDQFENALAQVAGEQYHIIVSPFKTIEYVRPLSEHLTLVSDNENQRGGRGFMFLDNEDIASVVTFGQEVNDKRICVGWIHPDCGRKQYENAAAFAAMQAAQSAPWLATNDMELVGCNPPPIQNRLVPNEINTLLQSGITPFYVGAGERVRCVRAISTYVKNDAGVPCDAFLDSFKIATADYVREAIRVCHRSDFNNMVLRDTHVAGEPPNVITPDDVRTANLDVCRRIEREGGLNNVNYFADKFTSVRHPNVPGRVDSIIPIDIVDALHLTANSIMISSTL